MADYLLSSLSRSNFQMKREETDGVDILSPLKCKKSYNMFKAIDSVSPLSSSVFGGWSEFDIPYGYIKECLIELNLGALTAGNYGQYVGLNSISSIELVSGSNKVQELTNAEAIYNAILTNMNSKQESRIKDMAGGTAHTSGKVYVPLPLFFSNMVSRDNTNSCLNTNLLSDKLKVRIYIRPAADLIDSGATIGSPTITTKLWYQHIITNNGVRQSHIQRYQKADYNYTGFDFQTEKSISIATATETEIDLSSIQGHIENLFIADKLVTDYTTSHDLILNQQDITNIILKADGRIVWSLDNEKLIDSMGLLSNNSGVSSTFSSAVIDFTGEVLDRSDTILGGFDTKTITKLTLTITHTAGANAYILSTVKRKALFRIRNGVLNKIL